MHRLVCLFIVLKIAVFPIDGRSEQGRSDLARDAVVFRFHMANEPSSFNPAQFSSTEASYFFNAVYRGLFRYQTGQGLIPEGAKKCTFITPLRLSCELNPMARWSDGSQIIAADYVRAFRNLLSSDSKGPGAEALQHVKGAQEAFAGLQSVKNIGVRTLSTHHLEIEFATPDPDFLYKTTAPVLAPIKQDSFPGRDQAPALVVNGPYMIERWDIGKKIRLKPNPFYFFAQSLSPTNLKPHVEILFIDQDETALSLYEQGVLTFLRRLPTTLIDKYRTRPDFLQVQLTRFDYIGFGTALKEHPHLRRALSHSLEFKELQLVLRSKGTPGCPALPDSYYNEIPCLNFNLHVARAALSKVPTGVQRRRWTLEFSKLGGDDNKQTAEWIQAQWKKNLNLTIDLQQVEQAVFLQRLRENPPPIFRKGVGLERPTCLAALETFAPDGAENFLRLKSSWYFEILNKLGRAKSMTEKKELCTKGTRFLIDENYLIPLGQLSFSFLAQKRFTGWKVNELNHLDLTDLIVSP